MATYKVIQDIEAEDKFVGPLTLKQFIFAMFGALFGYLSFFVITRGITWGLIMTLPPMFFGFFMAIPWSSEQPTDVWVLAKIRFRLKPNKRIWDQTGQMELVTITAPKVEDKFVPNISQVEVKGRLKALAETLDSRGWIIKNTTLQPADGNSSSDRLVGITEMSQPIPEADSVPDMLDGKRGLDSMINKSDAARKEQIFEKLDRIRQGESVEEAKQPEALVAPPDDNEEEALSQSLKAKKQAGDLARGNMHAITISSQPDPVQATADDAQDENQSPDPSGSQNDSHAMDEDTETDKETEVEKPQASMTEQVVPDIIELSRNNDLNVATIAREANRKKTEDESQEVVISLH